MMLGPAGRKPVKDGDDGETERRREHHNDGELTRSRERGAHLKRKQDDDWLTVREGHRAIDGGKAS